MEYYLKNAKKGLYLKEIDTVNKDLTFTKDINEAKKYCEGGWYADTELEFIQFHFKESNTDKQTYQIVKDLRTTYE